MNKANSRAIRYAGLIRRLLAIFYDCILLIALLFIASAIFTALNDGEAVEPGDAIYPVFVILLISLSYLYFAWFWVHGGQTLGMKTWRIQLRFDDTEDNTNNNIGWKVCMIRFFGAIISWCFIGIGFMWALFDNKNRCWHDILSRTVLVDLR